VDGLLVTYGPGVTCLPPAAAAAGGFSIGSSPDGAFKANGLFEALSTYIPPPSGERGRRLWAQQHRFLRAAEVHHWFAAIGTLAVRARPLLSSGHRPTTSDYALSADAWCFNQELKPDWGLGGSCGYAGSVSDAAPWNHFYYAPIAGTRLSLDIVNRQADLYEAMALAAASRSTALGATPAVGTLDYNGDLQTIWHGDPSGHNYGDHYWHSAQFRGDLPEQQYYWSALLGEHGFQVK